jgi:hypothetical protein
MANPTICSSLKPQNIGEEHLTISEENTEDPVKSLRNLGCKAYNYRVAVIP